MLPIQKWLSKIGTLRELTGLEPVEAEKIKTFNIIRIARYAKIAMTFFCSDFQKF